MPLAGRRGEMAVLEDELARAAAGEFRVVLLSGEAGVARAGWVGNCSPVTPMRSACSPVLIRSG
jgi:hypothetical protein